MEKESECLSDEPKKVPLKLLEEITNGFAKEAKLGSGTFGELYKVRLSVYFSCCSWISCYKPSSLQSLDLF